MTDLLRLIRQSWFFFLTLTVAGCSSWQLPATLGEKYQSAAGAYGYTPIDPLPVAVSYVESGTNSTSSTNLTQRILKALPDETMRLAVGQVQTDGSITYSPITVGLGGSNYVIVLDYIIYNTRSLAMEKQYTVSTNINPRWLEIQWEKLSLTGGTGTIPQPPPSAVRLSTNMSVRLTTLSATTNANVTEVPVYIGVGLRMTANISVISGKVNLANMLALSGNNVTGTLVIQTLGISGPSIASAIPLPSDVNSTTIQNALVALGTIKSKIYSAEDVNVTPRVVAFYNTLGGGTSTVNSCISSILTSGTNLDLALDGNGYGVATSASNASPLHTIYTNRP